MVFQLYAILAVLKIILLGFDLDTVDYANYFLSVATHHLVVKRPSNEPPLGLNVRRSSFVDGKACRFDCYYCQH